MRILRLRALSVLLLLSVLFSGAGVMTAKTAENSPAAYRPAGGKLVFSAKKKTTSSAPKKTVKVTVPEGYTATQIAALLQKKGVCKANQFLSKINSYNFNYYSMVKAIPKSSKVCYKLEGYLYPDTYQFYKNMKPQDVIGKMLRDTQKKIGSRYKFRGMTTFQIITLASIIQKEAAHPSDMRNISCVFHNRLAIHMMLQADSTVYYLTKYLSASQCNKYKYYYNTDRRVNGLPAGPICNPGANALKAAVTPTNHNYLYFYSDAAGKYHFSLTLPGSSSSSSSSSSSVPSSSAAASSPVSAASGVSSAITSSSGPSDTP